MYSKMLEERRRQIERKAFIDMTEACNVEQQTAIVSVLPTEMLQQELVRRTEKTVYILSRTVDYVLALRQREEELTLVEMEQAVADLNRIVKGKKTKKEEEDEQTNSLLLEQTGEGSCPEVERETDSQ